MARRHAGQEIWASTRFADNGSDMGLYYAVFRIYAKLGTDDGLASFSRSL